MNKAKPLYITVTTDTGSRRDAVTDIPDKKPNKAEFDQYAMMQSQRREYVAHIYSRGMEYTEDDAASMVNMLINDPLTRAGLIKRPVGLLGDHRRADVLLISDSPKDDFYTVVEGKTEGDGIRVMHETRRADRANYPLAVVLETYQKAGFDLYDIPRPEDSASRGMVLRHRTVKFPFDRIAGTFIEFVHKRAQDLGLED